jgi:hypothetical protein
MAWIRGVAALVILSTALTLGAPPCSAADTPQGAPKARERKSLAATATQLAVLTPLPRAFAQDASAAAPATASRSFLRSPTGVVAVVLMAVGGGYALYSVSHDQKPVKSPIR